ncbi:MFS transporter [Persicobacter psychrovividus]|uniref:MFS transporter n=2 Tax=Persicobacter psychrovividus TaxID=387638 RepID=A0ABN6LDZ7_9BACT|nr:MFS transporter [Persicobacter psychrovividus]
MPVNRPSEEVIKSHIMASTSIPTSTFNTQEKILLLLLAAVSFTNVLDFMVMMPLGHELSMLFSLSPGQWSTVISAYTFAAALSGFVAIFYIDKYGRRDFLMVLYSGFLLGTLCCAFADSYLQLVLARAFTGLFGGVINALLFAIVGDVVAIEKRGRGIGLLMMGFSSASALGVPFGLYFGVTYSWRVPFFAIFGLGLILLVCLYRFLPVMRGHITAQAGTAVFAQLREIGRDADQRNGLLGAFFMFSGHFFIIPFLAPYMVANVGIAEQQLTWIYFCGGLMTVFTSPWIGRLSDRFGKFRIFAIFALLTTIPLIEITNMSAVPLWQVLLVTTLFFVVGGRSIPANALILGTAKPAQRGSFMGVRASVQQLASASASFAVGFIVSQSATGQYQHYAQAGMIGVVLTVASIFFLRAVQTKY